LVRRFGSEALDIVVGLLALPFILLLVLAAIVFDIASKVTGWGATGLDFGGIQNPASWAPGSDMMRASSRQVIET